MRHLFVAAFLLVGALLATATLSAVLQNWATARASSTEYEPPSVAAPTGSQSTKPSTDTANTPQRGRVRAAPRQMTQVLDYRL